MPAKEREDEILDRLSDLRVAVAEVATKLEAHIVVCNRQWTTAEHDASTFDGRIRSLEKRLYLACGAVAVLTPLLTLLVKELT